MLLRLIWHRKVRTECSKNLSPGRSWWCPLTEVNIKSDNFVCFIVCSWPFVIVGNTKTRHNRPNISSPARFSRYSQQLPYRRMSGLLDEGNSIKSERCFKSPSRNKISLDSACAGSPLPWSAMWKCPFCGKLFLRAFGNFEIWWHGGGWLGGSGVGEVGYCVPLFGHQLHSALIHARQTSHNMGTGDLTFVIIKTLFYNRYM